MAIVTSQQIQEYYEEYGSVDVAFTKDINHSLRVAHRQVYIKYKGGQRPCIIYSSSLTAARIVVALNEGIIAALKLENRVSLRFCFLKEDRSDIFSFFVKSRVSGLTRYDKDKNLHFAHLDFIQRPPDDLIEILGGLLEANINAARRREERIIIDPESLRRLGIVSKSMMIQIDGIPRNGILRDISFGGLKAIIMGNPKFLINKTAQVRLDLVSGQSITVQGRILRFEPVPEHKELAAIAVQYEDGQTSLEYKLMINEYLKHIVRSPLSRDPATKS